MVLMDGYDVALVAERLFRFIDPQVPVQGLGQCEWLRLLWLRPAIGLSLDEAESFGSIRLSAILHFCVAHPSKNISILLAGLVICVRAWGSPGR